jgi:hypothetical protein
VQHSGHELWVRCLAGEDAAWEEMRAYQVQDVDLLIPLLERLKPWIPNYPHIGVHDGLESGCPRCGSDKMQRRGTAKTATGDVRPVPMPRCGGWSRGPQRHRHFGTEARMSADTKAQARGSPHRPHQRRSRPTPTHHRVHHRDRCDVVRGHVRGWSRLRVRDSENQPVHVSRGLAVLVEEWASGVEYVIDDMGEDG